MPTAVSKSWLALWLSAFPGVAQQPPVTIHVDAARELHRLTPRFIGVNVEDLNFQGYGGLYSQLLYGEAFQEHLDSAVLGLSGKERLKVFVEESGQGRIELRGFRGRNWEHDAAREALGLPAKSNSVAVSLDELTPTRRQALLSAVSGDAQVSRHWRPFTQGSARAALRFERATPFLGRQSQRISFVSGQGEAGIDNAGLNRWGIDLIAGKPYEGLLRVQAGEDTAVWVSLLDRGGSRKLAEKPLTVKGGNEYRRVEFALTPSASDDAGRFAITLKRPGSVAVGYAFLERGKWGRYAGLPLRKELVEALEGMGVTAIRYDGSMVNKCPDGRLYKWKEMIGPRDLRKPYHGFFNPYASHGFAIFEILQLCEAARFLPIPGVRIDETPEDMADFVEYVNGPANSTWGAKRAADGRPAPYGLKHLEIGNEERLDAHYCERFETLARAIWTKDPTMTLLVAHNLAGSAQFTAGPNGEMSDLLKLAVRLVRFARDQKGSIWWDTHYQAMPFQYKDGKAPDRIAAIAALRESIRKLVPDYDLPIAPLEENGVAHDMRRALTHARNQFVFSRMGDYLPVVAVANGLQAYGQDLLWSQGRVHFTASKVFFQPPYYGDQMVTQSWAPRVVGTRVSGNAATLDAAARMTEDGKRLSIYVVNEAATPVEVSFTIGGFALRSQSGEVVELAAAPDATNSPSEPTRVAPRRTAWRHNGKLEYRIQPSSFTVIQLN